MTKYGIDVSKHQGDIDWIKVKNSGKVEFAILRAGYGNSISQKDVKFEKHYSECVKNNIPVGAYWYSYAMSESEAKQEANAFLQVIKNKQFAYPVYFDLEEPKQLALGKAKCSAIAKAFMETMEKAGYFVGLYMSKSHLETYISEEIRNKYVVWVAHYGVSKTNYSGQFGIWQKSDSGSVSGISGNVDLNECYFNYPVLIQNAGLNGFVKSELVEPDEMPEPEQKQEKYFSISVDDKTYSGTLAEK
ncbi:MAG: glycoside hydrolase family 25 protein [Oscillospiraceae bacterium]|nr:glycoside hydrolase family 25 protein [Oscillospiraceae bacterium]